MDGWTVEHWIESIDAISPEDDRYGQMHDPCLTNARPCLANDEGSARIVVIRKFN